MAVDVVSEIHLAAPRALVAATAVDPDRVTDWYAAIRSVERLTPGPLAVGSRLAFTAQFLGRRLEYVYEVREHVPGVRFVMSTDEGPFPMETTYAWSDEGDGTRMSLRNRGEPRGFARVAGPVLARAVRSANGKDLRLLRTLVEQG